MDFVLPTKVTIIITLFIFGFFFSVSSAQANATVSVSMQVGPSTTLGTMKFEGTSIPSSTITFVENNTVIGTTISDSMGNFIKIFELVSPGSHVISIYTTDPEGKNGTPYIYEAIAIPDRIITIGQVILSPTASTQDRTIKLGEDILFTGYAAPSAIIQAYINTTYFGEIASDTTGRWSYKLETEHLDAGKYQIFFITKYNNQLGSASEKIEFKLESKSSDASSNTTSTNTPTATNETFIESFLTYTGSLLSSIEPTNISYTNLLLDLFPDYDSDNDNKISQEEGSYLIKEWINNWKEENINKCDINQDIECNLIDMSVALYYINR